LTAASHCEFAYLRGLDAKLGRVDAAQAEPDPMYERTSRLGDEHEHRVLQRYREQHGTGVVEIARPDRMERDAIMAVVADTAHAFDEGATVVFQATFFDEDAGEEHGDVAFIGFADFIVRQGDGSYLVQDTKLARTARVTALMQLAAYAEQLEKIGVRPAETVQLLLGDGTTSEHRLADITPVYRKRRARLHQLIDERLGDPNGAAVEWGDPRYTVCGHCDECEAQIQSSRDVLLVAGMRVTQRARLAEAGIRTIEALAESAGEVDGIAPSTLAAMRRQASLQLDAVDGSPPPIEVHNASALAVLPQPDSGDIFFDFEGDPLYTEGAADRWGLDYLFGLVDTGETFRAFWAHDFAEERQALLEFLDFVAERRAAHPRLHIYHYAAYERTHLLSLAARHGVGEDEVDQLLRDNVLVDLYPIVRKSVRVGSRSYSIKKLEPLYMGDELRESEVTNAAASITEYAAARDLYAVGEHDPAARADAQRMLDSIADYNRYDCVSTLRLRDWLLGLATEHGVPIGADLQESDAGDVEPSALRDALLELAGGVDSGIRGDRTADQTAAAFAAAAIDYHRREQKSFWWAHFARLVQPIEEWEDTRDVLIVERALIERDWFCEGRQRSDRRHLRLSGRLAPGSSIKPSDRAGPFLLYEYPGPFEATRSDPGARSARQVRVLETTEDGSILVEETLPAQAQHYDRVPSAVTPAAPPSAGQQKPAIDEWARTLIEAQPNWPRDPMTDILRKEPPRLRAGRSRSADLSARVLSSDVLGQIDAVTGAILDLDDSYLAVQGPPGTGKTYLGAHVITALVSEHAWKVGVVAQSHAVVENLLDAIVGAGLDAQLVGKVAKTGSSLAPEDGSRSAPTFTALPLNGHSLFALENDRSGFVIGGTAWDFSNPARIDRRSLNLLVIDEAGQFSLASTIAASIAACNLLLLGDPQQLPQVSQGTHPEPVDQSALGWISSGHDVLPPTLGFFLASSRRMHPAVAAPVSRLSYEGKLHAHPEAATRELVGIEPGLHAVPVDHAANSTSSPEEAAHVVEIVRSVLGRAWSDPTKNRDREPLTEADLIVVTPYNAQSALVLDALAHAGITGVRVGTVDKFQGQEAVVAIVTLAASAPEDVPRGMSFLLMKNRLNVAISRAQWAAFLVYSPALTDYLPVTPAGVAELSAFITLVEN
jgi:uncharacterized protein